jgi:hypothetical protein
MGATAALAQPHNSISSTGRYVFTMDCLRTATLAYFVYCGVSAVPALARQTLRPAFTQRSINEMAAAVEATRLALIDDAALRKPGEAITPYVRRIALPLPAETKAKYFARINGYLALLEQSAQATKAGRALPAIRDNSAANTAEWKRTVGALQYLPARLQKTERAWGSTQRMFDIASSAPSARLSRFDLELEQTVQIVIAASDGLRDVKP